MKILIVEDEPTILNALSDKFTSEKFNVLTARNGEEGLESALKNHPDLILLDIIMPKMDGMTMMAKLREDKWGRSVPIILLTNLSADEDIMRSVMRDMPAYYLVKSAWTIKDVVQKVKEKLGMKTEH